MRILYVSQYFPPEMGAPSARVHELSRQWVKLGHEVTVVTAFAHHPTGIKAPEDRGVLTRRETVDGIDVVRTYVFAAINKGAFKRMVSYASFMASAMTIGRLRIRRPDVVIGTSPQLLCPVAGYFLAQSTGSPFVFEVRDLWPEGIEAVQVLGDSPLIGALRGVARFLYTHSDRIVAVGEGYRRGIVEGYGIDGSRIDVLPNGVDTALFVPGPRDNDVRREYGWGDRFVAMYVGTHGMAHGLDTALEAARRLKRENPRVLFVFVGEGAEKENLKRLAAEAALDNVQFIDRQPKERIPAFYAACDLGLVILKDLALHQGVLPSKIFEFLGMERPILLAVGGEARRLVEQAGGGQYVPPGDPEAMARAVDRLSRDPSELERMGRQGRQYVVEHYDRNALAARYLEILRGVVERGRSPRSGGRRRA